MMRLLSYIALPLGEGVIVDPFSGSGSTVAAAEAVGVRALGIERHKPYFDLSKKAVPELSLIPSKIDSYLNISHTKDLLDGRKTTSLNVAANA